MSIKTDFNDSAREIFETFVSLQKQSFVFKYSNGGYDVETGTYKDKVKVGSNKNYLPYTFNVKTDNAKLFEVTELQVMYLYSDLPVDFDNSYLITISNIDYSIHNIDKDPSDSLYIVYLKRI